MAEKVEIVQTKTAQFNKAKELPKILSPINWTNHNPDNYASL